VKILTLAGCDIQQKTPLGLDPIHLAAQGDYPNLLAYFYELNLSLANPDSKGGTPLHWAAYLGSYYTTSLLCALNVDVNAQDSEGETPLHLATISGNSRVGRILLLKGVDKSIKDKKGRTALDIAKSKGSADFKEMLKDPGILEVYGYRPLLRPFRRNYWPFGSLISLVVTCFLLLAWFCFPCKF
jgi:palmitoyltransferase